MADYPALPLWTDALVADTDHLSHHEFGLYLRMLIVSWRSSKCDIPNDVLWIKKRFRLTEKDTQTIEMLIEAFFTKRGTRLTQKRLKRERNFVRNTSEKQSARAKSRWQKKKPSSRGNATTPHAAALPPHPLPDPRKEDSESRTNTESFFTGGAESDSKKPPYMPPLKANRGPGNGSGKDPPAPPKGGRKKASASRATSWPDGFELSDKMRAYAEDRGVRADVEFERFRDSALAKGRTYVDWAAAWRTWVNSPYEKAKKERKVLFTG